MAPPSEVEGPGPPGAVEAAAGAEPQIISHAPINSLQIIAFTYTQLGDLPGWLPWKWIKTENMELNKMVEPSNGPAAGYCLVWLFLFTGFYWFSGL